MEAEGGLVEPGTIALFQKTENLLEKRQVGGGWSAVVPTIS